MAEKRIRLVIEQRRRWVESADCFRGPCPSCHCEVDTVTRREAALFLETDTVELDRLTVTGRVHGILTATGTLRICKRSLLCSPG